MKTKIEHEAAKDATTEAIRAVSPLVIVHIARLIRQGADAKDILADLTILRGPK